MLGPFGRPLFAVPTLFVLSIVAVSSDAAASQAITLKEQSVSETIDRWLVFGPSAVPRPAFAAEASGDLGAAALLTPSDSPLPEPWQELWPVEGATWQPWVDHPGRWTAHSISDDHLLLATDNLQADGLAVAWLATYVETDRFVKGRLIVDSPHPFKLWLNGKSLATGATSDSGSDSNALSESGAADLVLTTGLHRLLIQTAFDPKIENDWSIGARIETTIGGQDGSPEDASGAETPLSFRLSPRRGPNISDYLDTVAVTNVSLSADGQLAALHLASPAVPADGRRSWIDLVRLADAQVIRSLGISGSVSGFEWSPTANAYAFATRQDETSTIWYADLETGRTAPVVESLERLESFDFFDDGRSMILTLTDEKPPEPPDHGAIRLRGLADRWPGWRDTKNLYRVAVASTEHPGPAVPQRLSAGATSASWLDGRRDGQRLLLQRTEISSERPFQVTELIELDLERLTTRSLAREPWFVSASYSPDDRQILVVGGPSAFGKAGSVLDEGTIANDYDGQIYLIDSDNGAVEAISRDFSPSVQNAAWLDDGTIVVSAVDEARRKLFRYWPSAARFEELETGVDVVDSWSTARNGSTVLFSGSSVDRPSAVYRLDLPGQDAHSAASTLEPAAPNLFFDPDPERRRQLAVGSVEDFAFTSSAGLTISGRVHYPANFDPHRSYPALVYYYGGTTPVTRGWGGRYPKNLWAANGYIVYVLQPSGATGFGQEVSARHVNNWGRTVAGEIIEGTQSFLDAHPFVDRDRVGCLGASYGGFMTLLLLTETDLFSAAISHAGISSLSSYWGEGWWGYLYSAVASADSYPWNDPDLYVGQSPLFRADRINTPLLLLHGSVDTNVPPGESEQMYTALTLLDRDVEFVRIEGSNHQVFRYPKRKHWMETIVAWFDKHLKDRPEYWFHLYPDAAEAASPATGTKTAKGHHE